MAILEIYLQMGPILENVPQKFPNIQYIIIFFVFTVYMNDIQYE